MAQFSKKIQDFLNNGRSLFEVNIQGDRYGQLYAQSATERSAFGEPVSVPINPVIQLDGLYGLDERKFETFTGTFSGNPGTATTTGTLMQAATDASGLGSYGVIRSRRAVRYRPGQGMLGRFTAKFTATDGVGVAGYTQRAGFFAQEQALQVGFDGEQFGVLRQNGGKAHIQTIRVDTVNQPENITITLNDDSVTFATTATTVAGLAKLIYDELIGDATLNAKWIFEWYDNQVVALRRDVGVAAGVFSVTTDGSSTFTETVSQVGVAHTTNWTYQSNFTLDTLDGNGPSGMILDPSKLNVFQINLRWLGAGRIQYAIEDVFGCMIPFHTEYYANENVDVHLDNPTMKLGYVAASLGGDGTSVVVQGASMMGAIEGNINITSLPTAHSATKLALPAGTLHHIFTIKNRLAYSDKINLREVLLQSISAGITETGTANILGTVYIFYNATNSLDHVWEEIHPNSHVIYSDVAGSITLANEQPLAAYVVEKGSSPTVNLESLRIALPPNNTLTVACSVDSGTPNADVSLIWIED